MKQFAVKVLLNRQTDHGRLAIFARPLGGDAYKHGDRLEQVHTYTVEAETAEQVLARCWSDFNEGSGTFVGHHVYSQRSLSRGDVLEIDGVRYALEHSGGKRVAGGQADLDQRQRDRGHQDALNGVKPRSADRQYLIGYAAGGGHTHQIW